MLVFSADIIQSTGNTNIVLKHLDISSQKSVRIFARDVNETEDYLHVLVHNAGILNGRNHVTEDGLELTLATNYFGPFLLTHLLVGKKQKIRNNPTNTVGNKHYNRSVRFWNAVHLPFISGLFQATSGHFLFISCHFRVMYGHFLFISIPFWLISGTFRFTSGHL